MTPLATPIVGDTLPPNSPELIWIDSRAASREELLLSIDQHLARARMIWIGFRHPSMQDVLSQASGAQDWESESWLRFAEQVFPGSRGLTTTEAAEIDSVQLKGAKRLGIKRAY